MPKSELTQREMKQRIETSGWGGVVPVGSWYKLGHFENDEQVKGAFELAYQQFMDGMGEDCRGMDGYNKRRIPSMA